MATASLGLAAIPALTSSSSVTAVYGVLALCVAALALGASHFEKIKKHVATTAVTRNKDKVGMWGYLSLLLLVIFGASVNILESPEF